MPRLISLDQIIEGMVLEQTVNNKYGQQLIPANTRIEEKHKKVLKTWGIISVLIKEQVNDSSNLRLSGSQKTDDLKFLYQRYLWCPRNDNEEDVFEMLLSLSLASNKNFKGSK